MSTRQRVIPASTAAQATQLEFDSADKASVVAIAFALAGVETVSVFVRDEVAGAWQAVYVDGAALTLTATAPSAVLEGGPKYGFTKTATVSANAALDVYPRRLS